MALNEEPTPEKRRGAYFCSEIATNLMETYGRDKYLFISTLGIELIQGPDHFLLIRELRKETEGLGKIIERMKIEFSAAKGIKKTVRVRNSSQPEENVLISEEELKVLLGECKSALEESLAFREEATETSGPQLNILRRLVAWFTGQT